MFVLSSLANKGYNLHIGSVFAGEAYSTLYSQVSWSLDQHLNNEVARQLLEEQPIDTKVRPLVGCVLPPIDSEVI